MGLPGGVVFEVEDDGVGGGEAMAEGVFGRDGLALGLPPDQVFKTLVALVDGDAAHAVVAVVPVEAICNLKALAHAAGGRACTMADPATAQRLTGYVVGGISPLGQKRALPTFVDESAQLFDAVYVSGGRRGFDIGLSPTDLLAMTGGEYAPIARERG